MHASNARSEAMAYFRDLCAHFRTLYTANFISSHSGASDDVLFRVERAETTSKLWAFCLPFVFISINLWAFDVVRAFRVAIRFFIEVYKGSWFMEGSRLAVHLWIVGRRGSWILQFVNGLFVFRTIDTVPLELLHKLLRIFLLLQI
jgi:hypothetical protein